MFSPLLTCLNSIGFVRCSSRNLVLVTVTFAMVRLDDVVLFFIADFLPALQRQIFGMMSRCFYRGTIVCWTVCASIVLGNHGIATVELWKTNGFIVLLDGERYARDVSYPYVVCQTSFVGSLGV